MDQPSSVAPSLGGGELLRLHNLTTDVANFVRAQLCSYLEVLAPLFRPRRVLGDFVEGPGRETVPNADQNLAELRDSYYKICGRPFDLRRELPTPIESISTQLQLHEWEYAYDVPTQSGKKQITVTSPLTWVISYPSTYSLSMLRHTLSGKQQGDKESLRSFALRACLMSLLFSKQPGLTTLLEGLRYKVELRKSPELGEMRLVTISAPLTTIRPADEVLLMATGLSGRTVFQEIVDEERAMNLIDPFQQQIALTIRNHNESTS